MEEKANGNSWKNPTEIEQTKLWFGAFKPDFDPSAITIIVGLSVAGIPDVNTHPAHLLEILE